MEWLRQMKATGPRLLFLDQNIWIELLKGNERQGDNIAKDIIHLIHDLVGESKLIVPLTLGHFIETNKRLKDPSRKKLAQLQSDLSDGWTSYSYVDIQVFEAMNYIIRRVGNFSFNIRKQSISHGIGGIMGGEPKVTVRGFTKEENDKIQEIANDPVIQNKIVNFLLNQYAPADNNTSDQYVQDTEEIRSKQQQIKDNTSRRKMILMDHIRAMLFPVLLKSLNLLKPSNEDVLKLIPKLTNPQEVIRFVQEFPMVYVSYCLNTERDLQKQRDIQSNDMIDIASYILPVAYFDYVVGEKFFVSICKQYKLDSTFYSQVYIKLDELFLELQKM